MYPSSLWSTPAPNVSTRHTKNCVSNFPILAALNLPSCEIVVFVNVNTYILTEGRNCRIFMKVKCAIALDVKNGVELDIDRAY